jgi:hypothetical protein
VTAAIPALSTRRRLIFVGFMLADRLLCYLSFERGGVHDTVRERVMSTHRAGFTCCKNSPYLYVTARSHAEHVVCKTGCRSDMKYR